MSVVNLEKYPIDETLTIRGNTLSYTNRLRDLYPNPINFNELLDKSFLMNSCPNDTLSVTRAFAVARVDTGGGIGAFVPSEAGGVYRPEITNYFFTYSEDDVQGSANCAAIAGDFYNQPRLGYLVNDTSDFPRFGRIVNQLATAYFCNLVYVEYVACSSIYDFGHGIMKLNISGTKQYATYDSVMHEIDNDPTWFDSHVITSMYVVGYYGTVDDRTDFSPLNVACYRDINENILLPACDMQYYHGSNKRALQQGGEVSFDMEIGDTQIAVFSRCNPSFWKIGATYLETTSSRYAYITLTSYINDELSLTSAYYSLWSTGQNFTGDITLATSGDLINSDKGETDPNGNTNANRGSTEENHDNNLSTDPENMGNPNFDPDEIPDIDINNYVDKIDLSHPTLSTIDVFNKTYAMTSTQLAALADDLWNGDDDIYGEIVEGLSLMGQCPMNGVIDVRMYPFDIVSKLQPSAESSLIKIGRTTLSCYGYRLTEMSSAVIDLGSCSFRRKFKNFLDYKPHTEGRLYLPYCGIVSIDTAEFMGRTITAKLIVDVITGACTAVVFADGFPVAESHGSCGIGIPVTGDDAAKYTSAVLSNFVGGISSIASAGAGAATGGMSNIIPAKTTPSSGVMRQRMADYKATAAGNATGAIGGVVGGLSQIWEAYTTPIQYMSAGAASPSCATWLPQKAYFLIDRPVQLERSGYGHTVGYACMKYAPLETFSGFTVCSNVDTSGFAQATEAERAELKALLETGVFLP